MLCLLENALCFVLSIKNDCAAPHHHHIYGQSRAEQPACWAVVCYPVSVRVHRRQTDIQTDRQTDQHSKVRCGHADSSSALHVPLFIRPPLRHSRRCVRQSRVHCMMTFNPRLTSYNTTNITESMRKMSATKANSHSSSQLAQIGRDAPQQESFSFALLSGHPIISISSDLPSSLRPSAVVNPRPSPCL